MPRNIVRVVALSLSLSIFSTGCFGSFKLVRGIYGFNKEVSGNKFVRWLVFLGLVIIPIYALGSLGDALIFNSIEFWGGGELAQAPAPGEERWVELSPSERMRLRREFDGRLHIEALRDGVLIASFFCEISEQGLVIVDRSGERLGEIRDSSGGSIEVRDAYGRARSFTADQVLATVAR